MKWTFYKSLVSFGIDDDIRTFQGLQACVPSLSLLISNIVCVSSFLTSAYLLEPVDRSFRQTGKYSPGRSILPYELAQPMAALAEKLGQFPYMEYASSYALRASRYFFGRIYA